MADAGVWNIMQNFDTKAAFIWITDILKKHNIPFQISGGLAANIYGSKRPLQDIDIDIPEDLFDLIYEDVSDYVVFGPERYKSEKWDLMLMTLNYQGQEIDICGAYHTFIFNAVAESWVKLETDFSNVTIKELFGLQVPVIPCAELLAYKKVLSRDVDLSDVNELERN